MLIRLLLDLEPEETFELPGKEQALEDVTHPTEVSSSTNIEVDPEDALVPFGGSSLPPQPEPEHPAEMHEDPEEPQPSSQSPDPPRVDLFETVT